MEYRFKTNINCGGCIAKITPHLNANNGITKWSVDTANPAKILTVETETLDESRIADIVKAAGFAASFLPDTSLDR